MNVEDLTGKTLKDIRSHLLSRIADDKCSQRPAKHLLDAAKAFVRWLHERQTIANLPPMNGLSIIVEAQAVTVSSDDERKELLGMRHERMRLYLLLMLNCGMSQTDVADLEQSQVDWARGRIQRKRSKTQGHENVPVVDYLLWDETFALLAKHRSSDATYVLLNENGAQLRRRELRNGKATNVDNIRKTFERQCGSEKITSQPLKLLRSTLASKLAEDSSHGRLGLTRK